MAFAMLAFVRVDAAAAPDEAFKVIVHPQNPVTSVDRGLLRAAYFKEAAKWKDGSVVQPIALSDDYQASERFALNVLGRSLSQLKSHWIQRVFSGKGVPPLKLETPDDVIAHVLGDRSAVGYLPAGHDPGAAKVVRVH